MPLQATSSIRSSSRHIAQRTASNRNTPESSVKSATNGPFSRSVSQPILPSGLRSSHRGPQDDSPFHDTTPPSIGKQGENLAYSLQNPQTSSGIYKEANGGHISSRRDESPNGAASPTRKHKLVRITLLCQDLAKNLLGLPYSNMLQSFTQC